MNLISMVDWEDVELLNKDLCQVGGYQHGRTSDGYGSTKTLFEQYKSKEVCDFIEILDLLRRCHKGAPFLFLNGNTFSALGKDLLAYAKGLATAADRSIVGHHIAGVVVLSKEQLSKELKL